MRIKFDRTKSELLRRDPRRKIGFEEIEELWDNFHYTEKSSQVPEQWRVIGWARGALYTVVIEDREDEEGNYTHLVTLWPSSKRERTLYEKNS